MTARKDGEFSTYGKVSAVAKVPGGPGRESKYEERFDALAENLALLGIDDLGIARVLGVTGTTLYRWKVAHPSLREAIVRGGEAADAAVARSLYERARGYSHPEEKIFYDTKLSEVVRVQTVQHYPPDTPAATYWLHNRTRGKWRREMAAAADAAAEDLELTIVKPDGSAPKA